MTTKAETRFVEVQGVRLRAVLAGDGPPVLLLHGFTGSAESLAETAAGLAHAHRTICVDLVGHGMSDAPRELAPYTMQRCADQLVAVLDDLGHTRVHLIGYSMGGRAALALASWFSERIRSVLVVGASAGIEEPEARGERVRSDAALADRIEGEGVEAFVDHWMALPLFASQKRLGDAWLEAARRQRLDNRPHGLANSLRGMGSGAQAPLAAGLRHLAMPVCLVAGAEDAKFSCIARELASRSARACVHVIADAGHACHLEAPDAFRRIALDFFRASGVRPAPLGPTSRTLSPERTP